MTAQPAINSIVHAAPAPLHVLIIGGGIGGLTLAQGLKKSGVNVAVFERDRTMTDRVQGYRLHINPAGSVALHECLPPELFETFARTCGKPSRGIRFLTERMKVPISFDMINPPQGANGDHIALDRSVSRITLRQVLLAGLDDVIRFGKTFERYEEFGRVAYSRISPTARLPRAMSWSPRMAAVRACGGSSCLMPSASTPGSSV
jgi:2-polyprenyl-6-methoxyphenol hydroxylase-like FAD-dependent oxidoreductase